MWSAVGRRSSEPVEVSVSAIALLLVLVAAVVHASWNLITKRVGGGPPFIWLAAVLTVVLYGPLALAVVLLTRPRFDAMALLFLGGSALLHLAYFLVLQRGYRVGDLSLVYPLARGTGPLLATGAAILLFGERPSPLAILGALLVLGGVVGLLGGAQLRHGLQNRQALGYALLTGLLIAGYTLWDKHAVSALLLPPLLLDYGSNLGRAILLAPVGWRQRAAVRELWRLHRWGVLGMALLNPLAYILVLTALVTTPVSYVAPAREVSILVATLFGTTLLAEGDGPRRLSAAGAMVLGVIALALG
jgi:drug/metabolite transporter (DMT)-like permease